MIVHIIRNDKFTDGFIRFIEKYYADNYVIIFSKGETPNLCSASKRVITINNNAKGLISLFFAIIRADKIILHGMFNKLIVLLIFVLFKSSNCYWCIWGGDLYSYRDEKGLWKHTKRTFVKKIAGIVTQIEGDYYIAKKEYGAKCKYFPCLLYPSNILTKTAVDNRNGNNDELNVLCGHYSELSAKHIDILDSLKKNKNMYFYIPLAYGDMEYANEIKKEITSDSDLKNRCCILSEYLAYDDYLSLLDKIDIAVFAYERQQACGNIIQLIGRGTTVFIRSDISTWSWLKSLGICVKDIADLWNGSYSLLTETERRENIRVMEEYATIDNLRKQWGEVLG